MHQLFQTIRKVFLRASIKYIIWDFDGTLYQSEKLGHDLKHCFYLLSGSSASFEKTSKNLGSWSAAAAKITSISEFTILNQVDKKINKVKYLKPNPKIVKFIEFTSKRYRHLILSNSTTSEIISCLPAIGFDTSHSPTGPFEKIFGRNTTKILKPDSRLFSLLTNYTKTATRGHLFIGDSMAHDIKPALASGFHATPIWELDNVFSVD
jgi:FMN phosphatase YigB (HAD superfamily)